MLFTRDAFCSFPLQLRFTYEKGKERATGIEPTFEIS